MKTQNGHKPIHRVFHENLPYFGSVFLWLVYVDITENTIIQIWTVKGVMELEKVIILQFHILHLFSMVCYPYTVQVHSWADKKGKSKWRRICYMKYLGP